MKLLHSKSTAEPILAVSACHCANLFGLVTFSGVTVYRSTTLTTVFTFALTPTFQSTDDTSANTPSRAQDPLRQAEHYRCCWSPSGRLFTLALPSGVILVFDVEGGSLVRVFTTAAAAATRGTSSTPSLSSAAAAAPTSLASPASPSSPTASSSFPVTVPWIATSLPPASPVLAMAWCAVPSCVSSQLSAMTAEVQTRCLPVRLGVTAALFDEALQSVAGARRPADVDSTAATAVEDGGERQEQVKLVSLLTVLGSDGVLRCLVGGLYEACAVPLALPPSVVQRGMSWQEVQVQELQWQQCAIEPRSSDVGDAGEATRGTRVAALLSFGETASDPVQSVTEQHHRLYLTVREPPSKDPLAASGAIATKDEAKPWQLPTQVLWGASLQTRWTALATPQCLALCHVREYARLAQETFEKAQQGWRAVLHGQVLAHLGLPAAAPLLLSAVMAQLTDPDPIALYKYAKQTLTRAALVDDLEALAKVFRTVAYEVTHVCYRCCEVAMAYAVHAARAGADDDDDAAFDARAAAESTGSPAGGLVGQLGALRRHYESFLRQAAGDGECARDLALWVAQQSIHWESGTHFVMHSVSGNSDGGAAATAYAEEDQQEATSLPTAGDRPGSPSSALQPAPPEPVLIDEVPVSATRQPALFRFLLDVADAFACTNGSAASAPRKQASRFGKAEPEDDDSSAAGLYKRLTSYAEQCTARVGVRAAAPASASPASIPLPCHVVVASAERQLLSCVVEKDVTADESSESDENNDDAAEGKGRSSGADGGNSSVDEANSENGSGERKHGGCDEDEEEERRQHGPTPPLHHPLQRYAGLSDAEGASLCNGDDDDDDDTRPHTTSAAAPHIASQSVKVHALTSSASTTGLIAALQLSSSALLVSHDHLDSARGTQEQQDAQAAFNDKTVETTCAVAPLHTADVDTAAIQKYLKADFTKDANTLFSSSWYGFLAEDRHVLVCQPAAILSEGGGGRHPAAKAVKSNAPFFIAVVQDDGEVVVADERDEEDEEEEDSSEGDKGNTASKKQNEEDKSSAADAANVDKAAAARVALCQVTGMEDVPLRVSMSRARSFCVMVAVAKYVVVSLYDDDDD